MYFIFVFVMVFYNGTCWGLSKKKGFHTFLGKVPRTTSHRASAQGVWGMDPSVRPCPSICPNRVVRDGGKTRTIPRRGMKNQSTRNRNQNLLTNVKHRKEFIVFILNRESLRQFFGSTGRSAQDRRQHPRPATVPDLGQTCPSSCGVWCRTKKARAMSSEAPGTGLKRQPQEPGSSSSAERALPKHVFFIEEEFSATKATMRVSEEGSKSCYARGTSLLAKKKRRGEEEEGEICFHQRAER